MGEYVEQGEAPVDTVISSSSYATVEEIISIADDIYQDVLKQYKKKLLPEQFTGIKDTDEYTRVVKDLQQRYKEFNTSFPIFIRWTVQTGDYSRVAFKKFLEKYATFPLRTMEDFLSLQRDYVVYLYKEKNPHWDTARVNAMSSSLINELIKEEKKFKKVSEEVDKDFEVLEKAKRQKNIDIILSFKKLK